MKFTDGYWLLRAGVRQHCAAEAYGFEKTEHSLVVYAPEKRIKERGDVLNIALLTAEFSSPAPDLIKVRLTHFAGTVPAAPSFELESCAASGSAELSPGSASFASGALAVEIDKGEPWRARFMAGGKVLTQAMPRGFAYVESPEGSRYMKEELGLGVGENVYGLGERFSAFVKNGQAVEVWNKDGGTASEQAYKSIPFYLTNRGYGVFVASPAKVAFEVASEKVSRVQFCVEGESLEYYLIYGPEPKAILAKYTALTGRPALPPAWSFGLWLSTSFTTSYDEKTITDIVEGMAKRNLPLSVFHFDCFWMREFSLCDFEWDAATFPDPQGMLARLAARGLKICVWINPYVAQRSKMFEEGVRGGYFIKKRNGDVWQTDLWQAGMAIVDFTNPAARKWFTDKLSALLAVGVDCFKTDFGERIPTDVVYFDGSDPERMHNYYSYLYNKTVFGLLREKRGSEAVVFARSGTAGSQRFPVHWGGDCESTFESMAESLRGGLSLGLSGFGFWSHDIGGFEGTPPAAVYKRWLAFGLLSSHSRLHGSGSYRVPWVYDEEAVDVLRRFTKLKCALMPYLYSAAAEASESGTPLMRAMLLEFPGDPTAQSLDRQYMLGPSLLVAPVFSEGGEVEYYLPEGTWTDYLSGAQVAGGLWRRGRYDFLGLPLFARPGSVVAVGACDKRPDYDYLDGLRLEVFAPEEGRPVRTTVRDAKGSAGAVFETRLESGRFSVSLIEGAARRWSVLLAGGKGGSEAEGARLSVVERGLLIEPVDGARTASARLR
jgi:alpha-D-xyloside xylohydrolase